MDKERSAPIKCIPAQPLSAASAMKELSAREEEENGSVI